MKRLRGLKSMVQDAVEHGSRAVERVQLDMAKTPFDILENVPPIAAPVKGVRLLHNFGVTSTHSMIRLVNKVTGSVLDVVIDAVEKRQPPAEENAPAEEKAPSEEKS